jgi:hypothetical protein
MFAFSVPDTRLRTSSPNWWPNVSLQLLKSSRSSIVTVKSESRRSARCISSSSRRTKRNKAFEASRLIGLALDGTGAGRCTEKGCALCHPLYNERHEVLGHLHHFSMISVVGAGLSLPFEVEPYRADESELGASHRLLPRAVGGLGSPDHA